MPPPAGRAGSQASSTGPMPSTGDWPASRADEHRIWVSGGYARPHHYRVAPPLAQGSYVTAYAQLSQLFAADGRS